MYFIQSHHNDDTFDEDQVGAQRRTKPQEDGLAEHTNNDRAIAALRAINAYAAATRFDPRESGPHTVEQVSEDGLAEELIADLICDLLHLADLTRVDLEMTLIRARRHYDEEREDDEQSG